jgi:hypothetical protein
MAPAGKKLSRIRILRFQLQQFRFQFPHLPVGAQKLVEKTIPLFLHLLDQEILAPVRDFQVQILAFESLYPVYIGSEAYLPFPNHLNGNLNPTETGLATARKTARFSIPLQDYASKTGPTRFPRYWTETAANCHYLETVARPWQFSADSGQYLN